MRDSKRNYNIDPSKPVVVRHFFHNYEHDSEGRRHCTGPVSNPYKIEHVGGKHKITHKYAKGHGKSRKPQWFKFTKRLGNGWDLSSGVPVDSISEEGKKLRAV